MERFQRRRSTNRYRSLSPPSTRSPRGTPLTQEPVARARRQRDAIDTEMQDPDPPPAIWPSAHFNSTRVGRSVSFTKIPMSLIDNPSLAPTHRNPASQLRSAPRDPYAPGPAWVQNTPPQRPPTHSPLPPGCPPMFLPPSDRPPWQSQSPGSQARDIAPRLFRMSRTREEMSRDSELRMAKFLGQSSPLLLLTTRGRGPMLVDGWEEVEREEEEMSGRQGRWRERRWRERVREWDVSGSEDGENK